MNWLRCSLPYPFLASKPFWVRCKDSVLRWKQPGLESDSAELGNSTFGEPGVIAGFRAAVTRRERGPCIIQSQQMNNPITRDVLSNHKGWFSLAGPNDLTLEVVTTLSRCSTKGRRR